MKVTWKQIRLLLMHEYLLKSDGAEASRRINKAWSEGTVAERTAGKMAGSHGRRIL
jgi:hypothetical protein